MKEIQRFADLFLSRITWPRAGLLFLVMVGIISVLTAAENRIKVYSGGVGVPDLALFFSRDDLRSRLDAFGKEGREIYLKAELLDLLYPWVYAGFYGAVIGLCGMRLMGKSSPWRILCLLPFLALLADYLENAGIFMVLLSWPTPSPTAEALAAWGNAAKWSLFTPTLLLALVGLLGLAIKGTPNGWGRAP